MFASRPIQVKPFGIFYYYFLTAVIVLRVAIRVLYFTHSLLLLVLVQQRVIHDIYWPNSMSDVDNARVSEMLSVSGCMLCDGAVVAQLAQLQSVSVSASPVWQTGYILSYRTRPTVLSSFNNILHFHTIKYYMLFLRDLVYNNHSHIM